MKNSFSFTSESGAVAEIGVVNGKLVMEFRDRNGVSSRRKFPKDAVSTMINELMDIGHQEYMETGFDPDRLSVGKKESLVEGLAIDKGLEYSDEKVAEIGDNYLLVEKPDKITRIEATREMVLDMTYRAFDGDWFNSEGFREVYKNTFTDEHWSTWLDRLSKLGYLFKQGVEETNPDDYRVTKEYRLSNQLLEKYRSGEWQTDKDTVRYKLKKLKLPDRVNS